jgi:hypothetical protein
VREYLRALRDSVLSLYEVVDRVPGAHLVLRDLVRGGKPVTVDERLGSLTAARWDRLGVRVLRVCGRHVLSEALLHFPFEAAGRVLAILRAGVGTVEAKVPHGTVDESTRRVIGGSLLANLAHAFSNMYLAHTLAEVGGPRPEMVNFEGDPLVFTTFRFPVAPGGGEEVAAKLDGTEVLECFRGETPSWHWKAETVPESAGTQDGPAARWTFGSFTEDSRPILGQIELRETEMMLQVNSAGRAERGKALVAALLAPLVGKPIASTQTLDRASREHGTQRPPGAPAQGGSPWKRRRASLLRSWTSTTGGSSISRFRQSAMSRPARRDASRWSTGSSTWRTGRSGARGRQERRPSICWMWRELGVLDRRQ